MNAESSLNNAKEGAFVVQWRCLCPAGTADVNMEEAQPAEGGRPAKKLRHGACLPCLTYAESCSPEVPTCLLVFHLLHIPLLVHVRFSQLVQYLVWSNMPCSYGS